ncbi:MAG: ribonuclease III family protein [Candidatus Bathyarchaeia archaeon]
MDHGLAALGDSLVNFLYSLALSIRYGKPMGARVDGRVLSDSISKAGLRKYLPSRMDRHIKADAAEAIIAYAWMKNVFSIEDAVEILSSAEDPTEAFSLLLVKAEKGLESILLK